MALKPVASPPTSPSRVPGQSSELAALPWRPLLLLCGFVALLSLVASASYGYFGDELYFLAAADYLTWGYADQQPLVPLLALAMDTLFPGSPVGLRTPAILVTSLGVLFAALIARELGGDRRAQILTAAAYAVCPQILIGGRLLATATIDSFLWTVVSWLLVRWVRLHTRGRADDRLLLWAGLVTALAIQTKFLIVGFWGAAIVAVLLIGPRDLLRRRLLWTGATIAVAATIPTLLWQAQHGWPQLGMREVVNSENDTSGFSLLLSAVLIAGLVGGALLCYGVARLLRAPELRPYRFLGVAFLFLAVVLLLIGGRDYYLSGLYAATWAAASVGLQRFRSTLRVATSACLLSVVVSASALTLTPLLPILPGSIFNVTSTGWPELVRNVTSTLDFVPKEKRNEVALITTDYWSASAIQHYAEDIPVYSGSRGFWYLKRPADDLRTVVQLGGTREQLSTMFEEVHLISEVNIGSALHDGRPIWLAEEPKAAWSELWPRYRHMSMWG